MSDLIERLESDDSLTLNPLRLAGLHAEAATAIRSLTEERDAAKQETERWKQGWSEMWAKLSDGTLHAGHCNADHRGPVGSDACSCHLGHVIKSLRRESAALTARVGELEAALREIREADICGVTAPVIDEVLPNERVSASAASLSGDER